MEKNGLRKIAGFIIAGIIVTAGLSLLTGCEDTITTAVKEEVKLAKLPEYTLTILDPAVGSVTPSGQITVKDGLSYDLSASAPNGYTFINWEVLSGNEYATFGDIFTPATTISISGGNVKIQPVVSNTPLTLTISDDGHGTTSPTSGDITVADGVPYSIDISAANTGYEFDKWVIISGTVVFGDAFQESTTATVTGGAAEIRATFKLKQYTINITNDGNGSTNLSSVILQHGVESEIITATPDAGYEFTSWSVSSGTGISFNTGSTDPTVYITATGGDATVQANFSLITYTLSITAATGGYVNPSGLKTVSYGVPFQLHAYPYGTYVFDSWSKSSGSGLVVFSDSSDKDSTVTLTGGDAVIQASFRKAIVTLTEVGSLPFSNSTTYPDSGKAIYQYGSNVYVFGPYGSNSVIRQINISSVSSPVTTNYRYISGIANSLVGNGTYMFAGTSTDIYKVAIGGFYSGSTLYTPSTTVPVTDLSNNYDNSSYIWASLSSGLIHDVAISNLDHGWTIIQNDGSGYNPQNIQSIYGGLLAVREDNGSHQLATYAVDAVTSATVTAADDAALLHNGSDMDPGTAGKPVLGVDGEYAYIPVYDPSTGYKVRIYDVTDSSSVSFIGQVSLTGAPQHIAVDDNYIYVGADVSNNAYIYVVDIYSKSSPVVRKSYNVSGFEKVDLVGRYGNYVYSVADTDAGKPTFIIYQLSFN